MDIILEEFPDVTIINVKGEFMIGNTSKLMEIWQDQLEKRPKVIGINCKELVYMDSSALGTLVKFLNHASVKSIDLQFYEMKPSILNIFKITKLDNFFTITTKEKFEKDFL